MLVLKSNLMCIFFSLIIRQTKLKEIILNQNLLDMDADLLEMQR